MNAVVHLERARRHILDRVVTDDDLLPDKLRVVVNHCRDHHVFGCSAFYIASTGFCQDDLKTLSFTPFRTTDGCRNTAYSSFIAHEYGHYLLHNLTGSPQGGLQAPFGEGAADVVSQLLNDDPVIGREWKPGQDARSDPLIANCQYPISWPGPCSESVHAAGQLLAGVWQRILIGLRAEYGDDVGLERTRQLHINWMLITNGNCCEAEQSAHPGTVIEILMADDDDGNLSNGTPHCAIICAAFAAHNLSCEDFCP